MRRYQVWRSVCFSNSSSATVSPPSTGRWCAVLFCSALAILDLCPGTKAQAGVPTVCDVPSAVQHALPSVVNIFAVRIVQPNGRPTGIDYYVGTGVIIDPSGLIVTNQHVIQDAAVVRVTFQDRTQVPAHLIGAASLIDLALLKVDVGRKLPALSFADSDQLRIGQPVIAIGNPIGVGTSVSTGVVSAINRNLMRSPFDDYIQTDASINPGNSGGPLIDCKGSIVGIDTALLSNSTVLGSIGIGFALPSDDVKFVAEKLRNPDHAPNWIGFELQDLNAGLAEMFGQTKVSGAIVAGVSADSPAAAAGLAPGDIITGVDGDREPDARAIERAATMVHPGAPVILSVWRHGETKQVTVMGKAWPNFKSYKPRRSQPRLKSIARSHTGWACTWWR